VSVARPTRPGQGPRPAGGRTRARPFLLGGFVVAGLAVALAIAVVAGPLASDQPDGLSRVAIDEGFAHTEAANPVGTRSPSGGDAVDGVGDDRTATGLAGAGGVVLTFAAAAGLFRFLLRRRPTVAT
jgi:hypothetical protein